MKSSTLFLIAFSIFLSALQLNGQPIDAEKLFSSPQYSMLSLSPDGSYVSAYYRDKEDHYINVIEHGKNQIISNISLGYDKTLNDYSWLNASQVYINIEGELKNIEIVADIKNGKNYLHLMEVDGYLVHTLPENPDSVLYAKRDGDKCNLYIVKIEALIKNDFRAARKVNKKKLEFKRFFYDHAFKRLIMPEFDEKEDALIFKYSPIEADKWTELFRIKDEEYSLIPVGFITDEKLAVITNKETDKMVLRKFDIRSQTIGEIVYEHPEYDLVSAEYSPDGNLHSVRFIQHGLLTTIYFDKETEYFSKRLSKTFRNQEIYIVDKDMNGQKTLLYVNGSDQPGEYFVYDSKKDQAIRLVASYPDLLDSTFAPSKLIKVTTPDGAEIEAFLTLPKGIDHSTLIVMPHGGPINVQEIDSFHPEVQYYAGRGFAVLRVNFRGSGGFGKSFLEKGVGEFGRLIESDITAAVDQVLKTYTFKHICAVGRSYGGYSAVMLAIRQPDLYECVVGTFGIYDLPLLFNASNLRSTKEYRDIVSKTVGEFSEDMIQYSPVYLSRELKAPILLIAGKRDNIAGFEQTNRFKYVLNRNNHLVETMFYKDVGHSHRTWEGDRHEAAFTYDYLMRTLGLNTSNIELDEPGKNALAEDYARIADYIDSNDETERDKTKAFAYYEKAAQLGLGRAIFNLGNCYYRGEGTEKNPARAVEFFRQSADQGCAEACGRLGRMYMEGDFLEQDWQKAHSNLTRALELDDTAVNNSQLARLYCTAPDPLRDIDHCLKLLDMDHSKRSRIIAEKARHESLEAISWMISEGKYTADELNRIKETVVNILQLKQAKTRIDVEKEGEFEFTENEIFNGVGSHKHIEKNFNIKAKKDDNGRFGIVLSISASKSNPYLDRVAVAARWVQTNKLGKRKIFKSTLLYGPSGAMWNIFARYEDIEEAGAWTLELYDLDQNKLYSREFHVTPLDKNKEDMGI